MKLYFLNRKEGHVIHEFDTVFQGKSTVGTADKKNNGFQNRKTSGENGRIPGKTK